MTKKFVHNPIRILVKCDELMLEGLIRHTKNFQVVDVRRLPYTPHQSLLLLRLCTQTATHQHTEEGEQGRRHGIRKTVTVTFGYNRIIINSVGIVTRLWQWLDPQL